MGDSTLFTTLGLGGVALFIVWMMVKYGMNALDRKDQYIQKLIEEFQAHVELCNTNFMKSSQMVARGAEKQAKAIDSLLKQVNSIQK